MSQGIKNILNKNLLYNYYIVDNLTISEVASKFNCGTTSIIRYLNKYGIKKPKNLVDKNISKSLIKSDKYTNIEKIKNMYINQNMTVKNIATQINGNEHYIRKILYKNNIFKPKQLQLQNKVKIKISKEYIQSEYIDKNRTYENIANELNVSISRLSSIVSNLGIKKPLHLIQLSRNKSKYYNDLLKDKKWFYNQYIVKNLRLKDISNELKCPLYLIQKYRILYGFKKTTKLRGIFFQKVNSNIKNKKWLYNQYIIENKRIEQIAKEEKISKWLVSYYIKYFGFIKTKEAKAKLQSQTNVKNGNQIEINGLTTRDICDKYNLSLSHVCNMLKKYKITNLKELNDIFTNLTYSRQSSLELQTSKILSLIFFNNSIHKDLNYRPDFKINDQIYLNVDGLYWHSEIKTDYNYHFKMRQDYEKYGFRLFQFREDEINQKPEIIKSIVNSTTNCNINKIFARKTILKEISQKEASFFLKQNHLMGSFNSKHIGLYHNNNLVLILSYKVYNKEILKIERFCSKLNTRVVGGFSKCLKFLENNLNFNKIHCWVDLRYGTGSFLNQFGFSISHETLDWKWTDLTNTYNRRKYRANMDSKKIKEREYTNKLNIIKIYDAGQRLYVKEYR